MPFNPLDYPMSLMVPESVSDASAWLGHIPFAFALVEMMAPRSIVELGTHKGDSYLAFCQAVAKLNLNARCTAVDTWRGDSQTGSYGEEVLSSLRATHDLKYGSFSRLARSTFDQGAATFAEESIDLLHIDGLHTYEAVRHDFEIWRPKLSDRAVVLFHDTAVRAGDFGVWRLWEEISVGRPNFLFDHSSGLGVLGVGAKLDEAVSRFFKDAQENPTGVRAYFTRLGRAIEQLRYQVRLGTYLANQQNILNNWKRLLGKSVDVESADLNGAMTDGLRFAARVTNQLDAALIEDLQLREQLQSRKASRQTRYMPDVTPRKISVIICSIDDQKFNSVSATYRRLLAATPHEIIRIVDARGMAEGYNRGIKQSSGDILIFSHDDVEIITQDFAERLVGHLEQFDLIGLAGTTLVCSGSWVAAGPPYLFGQVTNPDREGYAVTVFGAPRPVIPDIQAVDGVFFAVTRRVVERIQFDESLGGFHLYDVDFSYTAFMAGFRLAVINDVHAIHASRGNFNKDWAVTAQQFQNKWAARLPSRPARRQAFSGVFVKTKQEIPEIIQPAWWDM